MHFINILFICLDYIWFILIIFRIIMKIYNRVKLRLHLLQLIFITIACCVCFSERCWGMISRGLVCVCTVYQFCCVWLPICLCISTAKGLYTETLSAPDKTSSLNRYRCDFIDTWENGCLSEHLQDYSHYTHSWRINTFHVRFNTARK